MIDGSERSDALGLASFFSRLQLHHLERSLVMPSPHRLPLLALSVCLLVGCGDSGDVSSETPDAGAICEPIDPSLVEDCVLTTERLIIHTPEELEQICNARCSRIEAGVSVSFMPGLRDMRPFQNITSAEFVGLSSLPDLETLDGLENLGPKMRVVGLKWNPELRSIEALSGIEELEFFSILGNPKLESLRGLHNLRYLGGDEMTRIHNNDSLRDMSGLEGLVRADGVIELLYNDNLASTRGLDRLEHIHALLVRSNASFTELDEGLGSLETAYGLLFRDNPKLEQCEIDRLLEHVEVMDDVLVSGNATSSCEQP